MTYSNTLALSRSQYGSKHKNTAIYRAKAKAFPISNTIILIVLACLLGLFYLSQVTKTNTYGFTLNSLQQKQTALKNEYANLQVDSAQLQSVGRTQNSSVSRSMVPINPSSSAEN
jgi:cell division protein FtsL